MISSRDPRRAYYNSNNSLNRLSLPSLSEVISGTKSTPNPPPAPESRQPSCSLSPPFTSAASRQFNSLPILPPMFDRHPILPSGNDIPPPHHIHEPPKALESRALNGSYTQASPPPPPKRFRGLYQTSQLPAVLKPLPAYPISPRHAAPQIPGSYDLRGLPLLVKDGEFNTGPRYNKHFESWSSRDPLSRVGSASWTILSFAEAYSRIPEQLPTQIEVADMLANSELVKCWLEQLNNIVKAAIQAEQAQKSAKIKWPRGRAAPPGGCHSCKKTETPEWRRGPDGARTLCNGCGLHYAKQERKRQVEARSIRLNPSTPMIGLRPALKRQKGAPRSLGSMNH
ncbi:hypothetical protein S7711_10091 [Stachybotrys chartarum IBT 7711]|uniref:GATA-type domain-containing protein n=1 Tax=Stachybotrys chartarum (strain CBS 109288 / IBT 7711) TaxID=1280523 RepID=A0A084B4W5_STACB|nr:hypothetical protein S7711_10091 [Stachybotrys chartarum IBT 7711]